MLDQDIVVRPEPVGQAVVDRDARLLRGNDRVVADGGARDSLQRDSSGEEAVLHQVVGDREPVSSHCVEHGCIGE